MVCPSFIRFCLCLWCIITKCLGTATERYCQLHNALSRLMIATKKIKVLKVMEGKHDTTDQYTVTLCSN